MIRVLSNFCQVEKKHKKIITTIQRRSLEIEIALDITHLQKFLREKCCFFDSKTKRVSFVSLCSEGEKIEGKKKKNATSPPLRTLLPLLLAAGTARVGACVRPVARTTGAIGPRHVRAAADTRQQRVIGDGDGDPRQRT